MLWYFTVLAKRYRKWIATAFVLVIAFHAVRSRAASYLVAVDKSAGFASAQHAAYVAEQADAARASTDARSKSAGMNPERRLQWIRQCMQVAACKSWQIDAIIDGAPPEDQRRALRVSLAALAEDAAKAAPDGDDLASVPATRVVALVGRPSMGSALLDEMTATTLAIARRDPDAARGRVIKVSGRIIELRTTHGLSEGLLLTQDGTAVRFMTNLPVSGLKATSISTYRGVFVQRHLYKSSTGQRKQSFVVAGAFEPPANR